MVTRLNRGTGPKPKKGKRMSGHMGAERVTMRSLDIVRIIPEDRSLVLVKGPMPGPNGGVVEIRPATRLYKSKAAKQPSDDGLSVDEDRRT